MDKKNIILVSLGHLSCDINGGALPAALPYVRSAYHLDYQATGGLMLAYSCLSSVIQPFFGLLADRHNKPWFIPLGVLLAGLGLAIMGFMGNYWAIFAGIAISGVGSAFFHPEAARFANRVSGKSKGAGLSIFSIGGNSGFIIGPLLVTAFVGYLGLKGMAIFAILALCMAAILFARISRMPAPPAQVMNSNNAARYDAGDPQAAEATGLEAGSDKAATLQTNNWREFSKLIVVIVSRSMVFTGCNTFIPLYWVNAFNQTAASGAFALVVFGACGVGFNILGGLMSDRFGYVRMIRIAFTLMPLAVFCFALASSVGAAWALLPCLGFVLYLPFSSQVVLGQKLLAKNIGFASGVTLGLATTLGGVAQPVLGWVADNYGLHSIFVCLACIAALGATFSYLISRKADAN